MPFEPSISPEAGIGACFDDLHLTVSIRSFRAEKVSAFVKALLASFVGRYPSDHAQPGRRQSLGAGAEARPSDAACWLRSFGDSA